MAARDRAATEAAANAVAVANVATESDARAAQDLGEIESRVRQAAALAPLVAAVKMNVDADTFNDLFDSEEWWRRYRDEFSFVRLIVNGNVVATRGTVDLGMLDKPVVKLARRLGTASATVNIGHQPYLLAASRLAIFPDHPPIIVIGREAAPHPAVQPRVAAAVPAPPARPLPFVLAGFVVLAGIGVLALGRRAPRQSVGADGGAAETAVPLTQQRFRAPGAAQPDGGATAVPVLTETEIGVAAPIADATRPVAMLGRYRLLDRLGEGGMAELFVAEASGVEGFSRTFVLKKLRAELATEKDAVAQFVDEARLQASLVHSNIVPVFDFGMAGSQYFMTQEYIVGRDLARLMERHQQRGGRELPAEIAYFVAHEVLQALAYAHDTRDKTGAPMGIVHRDVSAGNVMVSFQGEVKLSDFGIVKSNRRVSRTQSGTVKGNANFMSPEQARGHAVDGRSDLFSLGLLLYYCLTGEMLYWGDNDLEVLYRAANGPTAEDLKAIGALPEPAASILKRALGFDAGDRFQSASSMGETLAAHMGGGKHAIARLMQQLFAEEIHRQTA
jgi:hypothetical protein